MAQPVRATPRAARGRGARPGRPLAAALALAVAAGATGCGSRLGLPDSVTTQGDEVVSLWRIFIILAALIAGLIYVLTAMTVIASIRRRRAESADADGIPEQHQYRTGLEIFYTAMPLAIVAVLLGLNFAVTNTLTDESERPDLVVKVVGFQWQWQFNYEGQRIQVNGDAVTLPQLWLPVGRTVRFDVSATDVIHSFWVPDFLQKRDMVPGSDNRVEVTVKEPGQWIGRCAEYCGLNHWQMKFAVCAVPPAVFDGWVRDTAARPQPVIAGVKADGTGPAPGSPACPSAPTTDVGFSAGPQVPDTPVPPPAPSGGRAEPAAGDGAAPREGGGR